MAVTVLQVEASRPEGLTQSATELGQKASGLSSQIDTQRATLDGLRSEWHGTASDAAIAKAQTTLQRMQRIHDAMTRAQAVLQQGGSTLTQTRNTVLGTVSTLRGQGWQVAPDGPARKPVGSVREDQPGQRHEDPAVGGGELRERQGAAGAVRRHRPRSEPESPRGRRGPGRSTVVRWAGRNPGTGNTAVRHRCRDPGGQEPGGGEEVVGHVAKSRDVTVEEVLAHPEQYAMAGPMMDRYKNALKVQEALEDDKKKTHAPTYLMVYEPEAFKGDGRAAIAIGDPDHSPNTAVVVPGTGNSVASGALSGDDATDLYNESVKADRDHPTAVVAWMGYDAPDALYDPRVGTTGLAHEGGQLLASDVNALNATHEGDGHMTVLGHSYGSTTVSDAA